MTVNPVWYYQCFCWHTAIHHHLDINMNICELFHHSLCPLLCLHCGFAKLSPFTYCNVTVVKCIMLLSERNQLTILLFFYSLFLFIRCWALEGFVMPYIWNCIYWMTRNKMHTFALLLILVNYKSSKDVKHRSCLIHVGSCAKP